MKFMLMMHAPRNCAEALSKWSQADFKAHIEHMLDLHKKLTVAGELVAAEGLAMPHEAKLVTAKQAGKPVVTDGPFPETKEFLTGFWFVKVSSAQRAYEIASMASVAPGAGGAPMSLAIEVREVGEAPKV
jgi:hypothetical protein